MRRNREFDEDSKTNDLAKRPKQRCKQKIPNRTIGNRKEELTERYASGADDPDHTNEQDHAEDVLHTWQEHAGDRAQVGALLLAFASGFGELRLHRADLAVGLGEGGFRDYFFILIIIC